MFLNVDMRFRYKVCCLPIQEDFEWKNRIAIGKNTSIVLFYSLGPLIIFICIKNRFPYLFPYFTVLCSSATHQSCNSFLILAPSHLWSLLSLWALMSYYTISEFILAYFIVARPFQFQCCCSFHCIFCEWGA